MHPEADKNLRFERLVREFGTDLYRYAMWICGNDALAKDLVQETFLRAWKALDSLKSEKAAKSWLITILRREYARTFERKVPKFTDIETVSIPEDDELEPEERL
ncbi:MAG: RNA polymerase sigma-70 factor (ECF subfamily), partial [Lysobacterales bacterium]